LDFSISWLEGNTVAGGKEYSDSDGNGTGWNTKGFITKTANKFL
jgi:hypothetical protein